MRNAATQWANDLVDRGRVQIDEIGRDVRKRVIEPLGEGLRAGAAATSSSARRIEKGSKLSAPVLVLAGLAGAAGEFFLDPQSGRRRRAVAKDRVAAFLRRRAAEAEREARHAAGVAKGAVAEATPSPRDPQALNDPALEAKVESEIFRDRGAPKGDVAISVENGVVQLRGELESEGQIEELVEAAREVEGVGGVENLLHLPGEEAPSKADGRAKRSKRRRGTARSKE
jgi:osmotically-inducible protein OsmY